MAERLPRCIEESIEKGAKRFGNGLEMLEYPNGGKDGPPSEINALLNVGYFLQSLPQPFDIYAEGSCASGRIDAMGFNGEIAFALEAKAFGAINAQAESSLRDLDRMREFFPEMTQNLTGALRPRDWWGGAKERWGIILISSFRGKEIVDAWQSDNADAFIEEMNKYTEKSSRPTHDSDGKPTGFHKLYEQFAPCNRGAALVTSGERWRGCGQGWFLWGAVPL
jgi:hypothetical protein